MDSKEYVSDAAAANMRLVPSGTLLASFKLTLGRLAYAGRDLYTNEAIAALYDIDEREISKRFLYWALTYFELPPENRTVTEATI
jgi:type I restriction enzyme S subunit